MVNFDENKNLVYFVYNHNFKNYEYIKQDLQQEGFLALFKACKQFDILKRNKFSTYAIKAIYNKMVDYLKRKEQKHCNNCVSLTELEDDFNFEIGIEYEFLKENCFENKGLTKEQIKIMQLKLDGFKQIEISKKMNISKSYVSKKISKIKNKMKSFI